MNQREYELIAYILSYMPNFTGIKISDHERIVLQFAATLQENYPKSFDKDKFMKACGL